MNTNHADNLVKSKERIQKHGEVFTPHWVVNDMLDLLPAEVWQPKKTFLEPACGEGAFLIEIFRRKLQNIVSTTLNNHSTTLDQQSKWEWQTAIATSSIYGIELLEDNAQRCKENLLRVFTTSYNKHFPNSQEKEFTKTIGFLIERNIIQGNALTYRKCKLSCGNECKKCKLIIFSEWSPVSENNEHFFIRKDYTYEGIINTEQMRESASGGLFADEFSNDEYGLVKKYRPVNFKKIRYATN